ncbi:TerD family protein [Streptomyces sp. NPDC059740]|uniref:TerD family protein n=1 Tax=Streptomyces sp. NPDC059740 TaxID=3346926 RepID=UPI00365B41B7
MHSASKGIAKVEFALRWDPGPRDAPPHDLDVVAATYLGDAPQGAPDYVVHFDSRSPDGTINLNRDSHDGQGFGYDEVMTLELDRLAPRYGRVVVGVVIQQRAGRLTFGEVAQPGVRVREEYTDLVVEDFAGVAGSTAATVVEFLRDEAGEWRLLPALRGYDVDPADFPGVMGGPAS